MGRKHEQTLLQRRHTNGQQTQEKMLNITQHQGNADQNHSEIPCLTPGRMAKINNSRKNRCWQGCGERGVLLPCWWECKLVQTLWKTVWRLLKKLKTELSYDPATAPLCIYPRVQTK